MRPVDTAKPILLEKANMQAGRYLVLAKLTFMAQRPQSNLAVLLQPLLTGPGPNLIDSSTVVLVGPSTVSDPSAGKTVLLPGISVATANLVLNAPNISGGGRIQLSCTGSDVVTSFGVVIRACHMEIMRLD